MIVAAIVVGVILFGLACYTQHLDTKYVDIYDGLTLGIVVAVLIAIEAAIIVCIVAEPIPSALDVYRGNTELRITSVNAVPTDTIVVFKNK